MYIIMQFSLPSRQVSRTYSGTCLYNNFELKKICMGGQESYTDNLNKLLHCCTVYRAD